MVIPFSLLFGLLLQTPEGPPSEKSEPPQESDYYRIVDVPIPDDLVLEVGGLLSLPDRTVLAATRRGEIYAIRGLEGEQVEFQLFAQGLQEPLGLLAHEGWIYTVQRGELSRLRDEDEDGDADLIETVCDDWPISGNYHEYAFGPRMDPEGNFWITLNKPFGPEPFGRAPWRGWAARITPQGEFQPVCAGLRSPAGVEVSPWGDVFYTDNQGEWCGASKLSLLREGDFHGHPWGLDSCDLPESRVLHPGMPPNGKLMPEVAAEMPSFRLPAVWFPYDKMGKSPAGILWDTTEGRFGPFAGHAFVGDQHHASVMRVFLEQVRGHWQGACFPFRYGFQSGVLRMAWHQDHSMLVGMTNRGWGSRGTRTEGLQRLLWAEKVPFEIQRMEALPSGFRLVFTKAVNVTSAAMPGYSMESYTYKLHSDYGSPEVDRHELEISEIAVAGDRMSVTLKVKGLREGYVHELHAPAVRSADNEPLLHKDAYYTLIKIPSSSE
ncbi:MAG: hypothetical protein DWQ01_04610 [Planctomycetota bacterium]|nr:MAG: hypothetical protein DWQ01_04610 [Planctomycetota bacterium]